MSLPTINDLQQVDPVLTNMLIGYMQADERFVAERVFPVVSVEKDSGTFYKFDKKYWMSDVMGYRAPGDDFPRGGFGVSTDTYKTIQFALSHPIADEERANSQVPMDLEDATVKWMAQKNLINKERKFAADFMVNSVWDNNDNDSTTDWDDFTSGDPVADVKTAIRTISVNTGQKANSMVCGLIVDEALTNHPDILDRLKYVQAATVQNVAGAMAAILGLTNYWVSEASYNTADEGQSFSGSAIIDDDALIVHVDPTAGVFGATGGKTFVWLPGGGSGIMDSVRLADKDADLLKHKAQWDQKAVATDLGYLYLGVV
jgi:hypothetical protein